MLPALFLPDIITSRYDALRTFTRELATAARARGLEVNPTPDPDRPAVYLFFNIINGREALAGWMGARRAPTSVLQWMVDHPFHADAQLLDELAPFQEFRYLSVADDDLHLMQLRWPGLRKGVVWHGVADSIVMDPRDAARSHEDDSRDIDVLVTGSIHTREELDKALAIVPASMRPYCQHLVQLRLQHPHLSFGQALDITMPHSVLASDAWDYLACVFRATTAWLNRERRIRVLKALAGCKVMVLGSDAWREHLQPGMTHVGHVDMHAVPSYMRRSKVCVAINPTQFTHAFSERLLQGLASGTACVTDDRLWVREQFGSVAGSSPPSDCVASFDLADVSQLRQRVDDLLARKTQRATFATLGARVVSARHCWQHRLDAILHLAGQSQLAAA